ncbi:MAG TPA: Ku protein [Candidatus Limnocylindrales bacterium]|jgi:DNA end-binding protein Ku
MARSMWKGAIQFGLVTIPVKLYLATESKGVSFNMLHAHCHGRIQMKTYCPTDDAYIERSDTVRGYEIAPGQYVVVTDDDLAAVPLKTVRSIEIEQFVPIDSGRETTRFVKAAYYMEPEPIARKAFCLLKSVLAERGLRAIAKVVVKDREQLAAIDPFASTMLLSTLHWPDEVRSLGELSLPEAEMTFKPAERAMAEQLVEAMTHEFEPAAYHDEYRGALLAIIEAKAAGAEIAEPAAAPAAGVTDLMAALQASVAAAKAARSGAAPETLAQAKARPLRKAAKAPAEVVTGEPEVEVAPVRRRKSA